MKKNYFLFLATLIFSFGSHAQCIGTFEYVTVASNNDGNVQVMDGCNYSGDFNNITGLTIGDDYEFTSSIATDYLTFTDDSNNVIASGVTPLAVSGMTVTSGRIHVYFDSSCAADTNCRETTIQCTTCTPPPAPDCASTPFPADGAVNVPVGNVTFTWEAPTSGPAPTSYNLYAGETPSGNDYGLIGNFTTTEAVITLSGYDTMLYWIIVPLNGSTEASGCSVWSFTTEPEPANFECTGAIPVACDGNYTGSTVGATDSGGNPAPDVWFSYTGSGGVAEDVTIDLCDSSYDTLIRVYSDCPGTNQVALNDDSCGTQSSLTFASDGNSTYYIMIEGYATASGAFDMTVTCAANIPAPPNDLCASAEPLDLDVMESGTTAGATDSSTGTTDDTNCQPFTFKADVWYSFVAPADGDVGIMTTITGTSDQASVAVYPDCNQLDADEVACSDGNGGESLNVTGLTAGNTYYVRVWSDGVAARTEGTFEITVSDATLSTEDFNVNKQLFTYYPNPVTNNLTLNAQRDITNVTVFNMLGQQVMRTAPNNVNSEVNMSDLTSGAYFVQVSIGDKTETIRIIKN